MIGSWRESILIRFAIVQTTSSAVTKPRLTQYRLVRPSKARYSTHRKTALIITILGRPNRIKVTIFCPAFPPISWIWTGICQLVSTPTNEIKATTKYTNQGIIIGQYLFQKCCRALSVVGSSILKKFCTIVKRENGGTNFPKRAAISIPAKVMRTAIIKRLMSPPWKSFVHLTNQPLNVGRVKSAPIRITISCVRWRKLLANGTCLKSIHTLTISAQFE